MTYRQSEKKNKNFEITFSELTLSLSVPFCDKVASFVLDCLPRDLIDFGIVNHGYEADFSYVSSKELMGSTSVLLRVKKPELIFYVESTSNKRRYFKTKTNVLMDYENRGGRENFSVNLGGTHSVFYNTGVYSFDPYLIVKHFDLEYINEYNEQSGQKISMNLSPVHVHLCSNVVHSLSDIFNDIIDHFKARDKEPSEITSTVEGECLWEPKKITQLLNKIEDFWEEKTVNRLALPEFFFLTSTEAVVVFELDQIPVLLFKSTIEINCNDWTSKLNFNCLFSLQANYFNEALQAWEPFVDPVVLDETEYKPWEASIKIMQDKAHAMLYTEENYVKPNDTDHRTSRCTTEDEDSADECMMYMEPVNSQGESKSRIKTNLSTFLEDSDSENEDQSMEKLASAISDLFTGDWNENEDSDCVQSSEGEEEENESLKEVKFNNAFKYDKNQSKSTYITIDAKNKLTFTITPDLIKVFHEIFTAYSTKILSVLENRSFIRLTNEIAPQAKIDLFKKKFDEVFLVCSKTYEKEESASNSPVREAYAELDNPIATKNWDEREDLDFNFNEEYLSSLNFPTESSGDLFTKINKYFLRIYVPNFPPMETPCYRRNWEKLIKLNGVGANQPYYLAAQHTISKSGRHVIISSPLKLKNETPHSLNILYQPSVLQQLNLEPVGNIINPFDTLMRITILEAYEEFNVPLYIAYHCKLFIQPAHSQGHYASETGIWWEDLATQIDTPINLQCNPKTNTETDLFCLKVVMRRNLDLKVSKAYSVPNYTIQLMPPVIINNMLPYRLEIKNKTVISMEPGEKVRVYSMDVSKDQKLPAQLEYNGVTCRAILNLNTQLDDKILVFTDESLKPNLILPINIKIDREGSCNIFFYTPYWIVNKTQLPVQLKASGTDAIINCDKESILLFTYKRHGKPSINMRVHNSNWSNDFGMECAGTTGLVVCKDHTRRKKYMVFTKCSISNICPQLTKIVTLMPSFIIVNHTEKHLRFMEHNEKTDLWNDLEPSQKMIFWPETNSMQMYVKFRDHKVISPPFFITTHHKTVLKMDKNGALTVEVIGGVNEPFTISFQSYKLGDAPIVVRNCCENKHLKISQQGHTEATLLNPNYSFMYTWDDPTTSRKLVWNVYGSKGQGFYIDITKDGFGEQKIRCQKDEQSDSDSSDSTHSPKNGKTKKDRRTIYWICYRDGLQRVLLFTQDCGMYRSTLKHVLQEKSHLDLLVSLSGVDFSIFTNQNRQKEHVLLSLSESPAIWEVNVGKKWKTLTLELASWIEDNYRMHHKNCQLKDYVYVDFDKMYMIKPFIAEIRRSYSPAVYIHFRKSDKYHYYNFKIQDLQIDDQHKNIIVVRPTLSKNIQDSDSFIDIAISKYTTNICQAYRYITIEIGDFALNVEKDLVTHLSQLLSVFKQFQGNALKGYFKDMSYIYSTFLDKKMMQEGIKTVIENVSIKDFIIQLNTGNETTSVLDGGISAANFLNYLFPMNVFPYMPIQGVNHKIPSIEHIELNQNLSQCLYYLFKQVATLFLQQYYSHVLGLQVLINYFAFYPSIEYNRLQTECISNVLYGTRCLLGHINMSPAALEQSILEIFENINMDEALLTRNQGVYFTSGMFPKLLAASSKNVETGVPIALSQLFTPNQKTNIVNPEKFFKTTGKALFALLTKYPDGMSDSVEVAVEAVKRASILGEPIQIKRRLTRYGSNILGLKPISLYGSLGKQLLDIIANGKFQSDTYCIHAALDKIGKFIIIVTLEHIIKVNKVKIWGPWDVEWVVDMDDVIKVNKNDQSELVIQLRSGKMGDSDHLRISSFKEIVSWLNDKIEQAMMINLESNSWTIPEI
ncbi:unnamed protein product [Brassicogethes aeneus]|uniref:Uncharacterized protein n=1 Tax=Brassicogethes aeneus TaxID=1431903 RepID=A0A9P0BBU9_BRAAE|nr:unnamed protein product [Brassicogethes aeneus]